MGTVVFGHHDQAAGVLVEPVHNAGAQIATGGGELFEAEEQRVHQGAAVALVFVLPRSGVHHHSGGLVDHSQIGVLEDHVQRNVFGGGFQGCGARLAGYVDPFAAAQFE